MRPLSFFLLLLLTACSHRYSLPTPTTPVAQRALARVDNMPNHPKPYAYKDWRQTTLDFDRYVFDFTQKGDYLPLIWLDSAGRNFPETTFGLYTAIGDVRMGAAVNHGENHEALGATGAVLSATLVGIDKRHQDGHNYVHMLRNYYNRDNGWNVIMNFTNKGAHIGGGYGNDFWYEVHNNVLFYSVAYFYPQEAGFDAIQLRKLGFSLAELKAYGYGAGQLKDTGAVIKELHELGFSLEELLHAGFTARAVAAVDGRAVYELKEAGYAVRELREYGYVVADMRGIYSVKDLKDQQLFGSGAQLAEELTALEEF
jgi:hypothetical protein